MATQNTGKNIGKQGQRVLNVGNPGNKGGTGRPPSAVRKACLLAFDKRIKVLEQIADDKTQDAKTRIDAIEKLGKYGLGTKQEVTGEDGGPMQSDVRIIVEVVEKVNEIDEEV